VNLQISNFVLLIYIYIYIIKKKITKKGSSRPNSTGSRARNREWEEE
jgi:hypothetical protein